MKENERKCYKCGCSPAEDPNITLHRFPKPGRTNILRCELWAKYCFPHNSWSSPEFQNQLFSKHYMLCNKHFKKSSFIDNSGKRLFKSAVPDEECDKIASSAPTLEHSNEFKQPIAGPSKTRQPLSEILANAPVEDFDKVTSSEPILVNTKVFEPIAGPSKMNYGPIKELVWVINHAIQDNILLKLLNMLFQRHFDFKLGINLTSLICEYKVC